MRDDAILNPPFLLEVATLKNQYFGMRHGESLANQQNLVVSTPENGVDNYGLSERGKQQAKASITLNTELEHSVQIISSDFKRTRETAEIAHSLLKSDHTLILDARLRERDFGDFELTDNSNYQKVWDNDAISSAHTIDNAESADAVMERATKLVISLESEYTDTVFLLVAHGDTLQILQAAFLRQPASKQRELPHLETAEIRELVLGK